jgi:hypothetical protein
MAEDQAGTPAATAEEQAGGPAAALDAARARDDALALAFAAFWHYGGDDPGPDGFDGDFDAAVDAVLDRDLSPGRVRLLVRELAALNYRWRMHPEQVMTEIAASGPGAWRGL